MKNNETGFYQNFILIPGVPGRPWNWHLGPLGAWDRWGPGTLGGHGTIGAPEPMVLPWYPPWSPNGPMVPHGPMVPWSPHGPMFPGIQSIHCMDIHAWISMHGYPCMDIHKVN